MEPSLMISIMGIALTAGLAYLGAQRGVSAKLAALEAKVDVLSVRVDYHNHAMERISALEARVDSLEKEDGR